MTHINFGAMTPARQEVSISSTPVPARYHFLRCNPSTSCARLPGFTITSIQATAMLRGSWQREASWYPVRRCVVGDYPPRPNGNVGLFNRPTHCQDSLQICSHWQCSTVAWGFKLLNRLLFMHSGLILALMGTDRDFMLFRAGRAGSSGDCSPGAGSCAGGTADAL